LPSFALTSVNHLTFALTMTRPVTLETLQLIVCTYHSRQGSYVISYNDDGLCA